MTIPAQGDELDQTSEHLASDPSEVLDRLAEEFAARFRRGETPTVNEYVNRYPDHATRIRELLPSVAMMEGLKRQVRASSVAECDLHDPAPERLGEYRIVRELGRGGMGIVYEAYQETLDRHVALKVIPRHGMLDARRRRRFQREAMAVAQLHHTNIVPIFQAGEHDGLPFYAMQYIRGEGLDRMLDRWRRPNADHPGGTEHWRFVAGVGMQAAEALQYAHGQGILHRDIKPANILVDEQGVAWITDFGLAKLVGRDDLTNSGDVVGTLRYMAPEVLSGRTDRSGDIYSLGLTLYELLTLRPPFGDLSPSELLRCVTEEQPIRPRQLDRTIPLDLETIVLKATSREPERRYATAGELAEDLRAFLGDRPIRARRASPPERLARWVRRNRVLAVAMVAVAASMIVALAAVTWGYVTTHQALERQDANVQFLLASFERLFNQFSDPSDEGPFADGRIPWAPARAGRPGGEPGSRPGPGHSDRFPGVPGPPPGSRMPHRLELTDRELALLEIVLEFYDGFAARNQTNELQGEAARAYRKVAALYRWLGRDAEADEAHAKAVRGFEALLDREGEPSEYAYELARTLALDVPGAWTSAPERVEPDLRRAIAIAERLFLRADEKKQITYAAALARWNASLGKLLESLGRPDEAIGYDREAIARDEWLANHLESPGAGGVRNVILSRRTTLAALLARLHHVEEARAEADRVVAESSAAIDEEMPSGGWSNESRRRSYQSLAGTYRAIGEEAKAAQMEALVARIPNRNHNRPPGAHQPMPMSPRMPARATGHSISLP